MGLQGCIGPRSRRRDASLACRRAGFLRLVVQVSDQTKEMVDDGAVVGAAASGVLRWRLALPWPQGVNQNRRGVDEFNKGNVESTSGQEGCSDGRDGDEPHGREESSVGKRPGQSDTEPAVGHRVQQRMAGDGEHRKHRGAPERAIQPSVHRRNREHADHQSEGQRMRGAPMPEGR